MDSENTPIEPLFFADRVISTMARNMLGRSDLKDEAYQAIRFVFAQNGGKWESLARGDQKAHELLGTVVSAWGKTCPASAQE